MDKVVAFERYAAYAEPQETRGIVAEGFEKVAMQGDEYTLVGAHRGESPSTGYAIRIEKIMTDGAGNFEVHVTMLDPDPELQQADVLTYPVDSVLIEGYDRDAKFTMVVGETIKGPHPVIEVEFVDYTSDWIEPGSMLDEFGVLVMPLVAQTSAIDTALAIHRPLCPTTGYDIVITRITMTVDGRITVYARLIDPEPGSIQGQVITQPFHSVRIAGYRSNWEYTYVIQE
jgi:hypothetical protein